jgi:hypothetical protein
VLAARDHSGAVPLMEGRTAAGSLIIACGTFLPEGVTCMSDIKPGEHTRQRTPIGHLAVVLALGLVSG